MFEYHETIDVRAHRIVDARVVDGFDVVLVKTDQRKLAGTEHARRFEVVEQRTVQIVQQYVFGSDHEQTFYAVGRNGQVVHVDIRSELQSVSMVMY